MSHASGGASSGLIELAGEIVAAYVSNNHVAPADLPVLIASVHAAMSGLTTGYSFVQGSEPEAEKPTPAQIRKSVQPNRLISFIDGKSYKTLKRHLTANGLTPATYRERFGLPADYPMVSPEYSVRRSSLAKSIGLGRFGGQGTEAEVEVLASRRRKKTA